MEKPAPDISVVIPAYNAEKTIAATLRSIFDQTQKPTEVIVVDDGSSDGTRRVVQTFAPDVRLIEQPNAGPAAARNHGIREAKSEWIALIDADDSWVPTKLEKQVRLLGPDVALVHTYVVGSKDRAAPVVTFDDLWEKNTIGTSTVILNKTICEQVGGFDERRSLMGVEDYNLWLRLAATEWRLVTLPEELSHYTQTEISLSRQVARVIEAELLNIDTLRAELGLSESQCKAKRIAILEEYAKSLFWRRDLPLARRYYSELLQLRPSASSYLHWGASFLPVSLLNLPRRLASRSEAPRSSVQYSSDLACSR